MKTLSFIFLFFIASFSYSQTRKAFIDKTGKYTANPQGAVGYVLITKLDGDSAYLVKRFDMADTIVFSGTYKDAALSIPNGRFVYYDRNRLSDNLYRMYIKGFRDIGGVRVDTSNFVREAGYYSNGKKEGLWVKYAARGLKASEIIYQNGKQNGKYKIYANHNEGWIEGTIVNDMLEGKLYKYNSDSVLVSEDDMKHGRMINEIVHLQYAKENPDFDSYLEAKLGKYKDLIVRNFTAVKYTVDSTGKILHPQIVKGINPEFNDAVIAALLSAPNYKPATYDGSPITENINKQLTLFDYYDNKNMGIRRSARQNGGDTISQH